MPDNYLRIEPTRTASQLHKGTDARIKHPWGIQSQPFNQTFAVALVVEL